MAKIDDGLLYLEIEGATEEQLRRGLTAARQHIARSGVFIEDAMQAAARRDQEIAWEKDEGEHPGDLSDDEYDNADLVDEALRVGLNAAGFKVGRLGLIEPAASATRDLFEAVSC